MQNKNEPFYAGACAHCGGEVMLFQTGMHGQLVLCCSTTDCDHGVVKFDTHLLPYFVQEPGPLQPNEVVIKPRPDFFPSTYTWKEVFPFNEQKPWERKRMTVERYEMLRESGTPGLAVVGDEEDGSPIILPYAVFSTLLVISPEKNENTDRE